MGWFRACAVLTVLIFGGCSSVEEMRTTQGSGQKRTYGVSYERAWNLIPYAISDTGGKVKDRNFERGYVVAEYGMSWTSLGERVALFCQRRSANEVEIEVVSKGTLSLNLSGADWTTKIFASLDRQLKP